jgi:hypothetical protein
VSCEFQDKDRPHMPGPLADAGWALDGGRGVKCPQWPKSTVINHGAQFSHWWSLSWCTEAMWCRASPDGCHCVGAGHLQLS